MHQEVHSALALPVYVIFKYCIITQDKFQSTTLQPLLSITRVQAPLHRSGSRDGCSSRPESIVGENRRPQGRPHHRRFHLLVTGNTARASLAGPMIS